MKQVTQNPKAVRLMAWLIMNGALYLSLNCGGGRQEVKLASVSEEVRSDPAELQNKVRQNPGDARSRAQLGTALIQEQNYAAALAQFDSALALQPDLLAAKFGRADAIFLQGKQEEGMRGYLETLNAPEAASYVRIIAERIGTPYAIRQITAMPGENMMARFSPDGRALVFQSNRDGNWEIYRALPDGSQPVRLTNHAAADEAPCFSPDGRKIAFARAQDNAATRQASPREVYLMDAQTGKILSNISRHPSDDWNPAFAPKGDQLAFVSDRDDSRPIDLHERQSDIFLFHLSDSTLTRFSQGFGDKSAPGFAPDGQSILYVSNLTGEFDIFEQRMSSAQPVALISNNGSKGAPQPSPDGRHIVYFEKRHQNFDLYLYNRETRKIQRLTCDPDMDAFPVFSSDGSEIYFTSKRSGSYQIHAMSLRTPASREELVAALHRLVEQQKLSSQ